MVLEKCLLKAFHTGKVLMDSQWVTKEQINVDSKATNLHSKYYENNL